MMNRQLFPMIRFRNAACFARWLAGLAVFATVAAAAEPPSFRDEILPLLSDRCFHCHGFDAGTRFPKHDPLRLDDFAAATAVRDDGSRAIIPGDPAASLIIRRIRSTDPDEVMPPPETHKPLAPEQIATLERWIAGGAKYQRHWAFEPLPTAVAVPDPVPAAGFPLHSPVDAFVLDRLRRESLAPAPAADRAVWLRRASYDLTGLAPGTEDLDAFLNDPSPAAFGSAVDRLLASPAFGERWAMHWMEVARYADSFGYQSDLDTHAWPWRDWVIEAFNRNLTFDQFLTWQLAGDLLPDATREQHLATAFNRIHRKTQEGGSVEAEFRQEGVSDRVHTVGTAFLALTMECARCHDHKYDPIAMREYYSLGAFFNSIDEWGLLHGTTGIAPRPVLLLPTPEQETSLAKLAAAVDEAEANVNRLAGEREQAFLGWLAARPADPAWTRQSGSYALDEGEGNQLANSARPDKPGTFAAGNRWIDGRHGKAVAFSGDDPIHFDKGAASASYDPLAVAFWMKTTSLAPRMVVFHSTDGWDPGYNGYELLIEDGRLRWTWQREWPGDCISVRVPDPLPINEWVHVAVSYDGSSSAAGLRVFLNGRAAETETIRDKLVKNCGSFSAIHFGARRRDNGLAGGAVDEIRIFDRPLTALEAAELAGGETLTRLLREDQESLDEDAVAALREYWLIAIDDGMQAARAALREARAAHSRALDGVREIPAMEEMAEARPVYILDRGEYGSPVGDPLPRVVMDWLVPMPDGAPDDRLGFAQWLLRADHPLTARVTVNRFWQEIFGTGLVATSDNFGLQGSPPSHPELLDWLARDFIAHGWDVKRLLRTLVLSSTYRQSSTAPAALRERDPDNRLLARGPAKRQTAEMLRDSALAIGAILNPKIGGPPAHPPQPDGSMWRTLNSFLPEYKAATGTEARRRSLYTFWRRTTPPPNMMAFDAASRDVCAVSRQSTNTPLQPLVTLNDPQFTEAAGGLARHILTAGPPTGDEEIQQRLARAFQAATARPPDQAELALLATLYREQIDIFQADPTATAAFLAASGLGNAPGENGAFPTAAECAAAAVTASALLNLDAFLMVR